MVVKPCQIPCSQGGGRGKNKGKNIGEEKMSNDAAKFGITEKQLEKLEREFPRASFAVWLGDEEKVEDEKRQKANYKNIIEKMKKLESNINIILLGLSRGSKSKLKSSSPFYNFHSTSSGDNLLRDTISKECKELEGAYMTDISRMIESKSGLVNTDDKDIDEFKKQLEILGEEEYFVVCFGDKAFGTLTKLLKDKKKEKNDITTGKLDNYILHCYKVPHFKRRKLTKAEHEKKFKSEFEEANKLIQEKIK